MGVIVIILKNSDSVLNPYVVVNNEIIIYVKMVIILHVCVLNIDI